MSPSDVQLRYFEWCAAMVAMRMATLTPEQIWVYAFTEPEGGFLNNASLDRDALSFHEALKRAVRGVARDLDLPPLEDWALRYAADPEPFGELIRQFTSVPLSGDDVRPSAS